MIVSYDHKVLIYDYESTQLKEFEHSHFDQKTVVSIEIFAREDYVAFGCSDGVTRLWNVLTGEILKTEMIPQKSISFMHSYIEHDRSYLCNISSDGVYSKWRLNGNSDPVLDFKSNGYYDVNDVSPNSNERVISILTDKQVLIKDYINDTDSDKVSISSKKNFTSISYFNHSKHPKSSVILLSKDGKSIYYSDLMFYDETLRTLITVNDLPKHEKAKLTYFQIHPTKPHKLIIISNIGFSIVHIDEHSSPNFAIIKGESSKIFYPLKYAIYTINSYNPNQSPEISFPEEFYKLPTTEEVEISVSSTQNYMSLLYPRKRKYEILSLKDKKVIETGNAIKLIWSYIDKDKYAFIDPEKENEGDEKRKKKEVLVKKSASLKVKTVGKNNTAITICNFKDVSDTSICLYGGILLSVGRIETLTDISPSSDFQIQFYSWDGDKVGVPLPSPTHVNWEHTGRYCLLAYQHYFCIFTTKPKFKLMYKIMGGIISSLWHNECLYYSTEDSIKCFDLSDPDDSRETILYSFPREAFTSLLTKETKQKIDVNSSIVEIVDDNLVLLTTDLQITHIPLEN